MLDASFLKTLTILYVEDDIEIVENIKIILSKVFRDVITAPDGEKALSIYKKSIENDDEIDVIISDINMPNMDGIQLLQNIRKFNQDIPYIFVTAHTKQEYLLKAIKNNISYYGVKPVDTKELVKVIQNVCKVKYEHKLAMHNYHESQEYLKILNKVAIVSKTDTKGNIIFVNDIFCDTSGYTRDELLNKPHNIIRHPDMPAAVYKSMWDIIKNGQEWSGKVKNKAKNGESYYVNATIFPLYDEIDTHIIGYMAIRFLTTEDENQKREFRTQVRELVSKNNTTISELRRKTDVLESNHEYLNIELLENKVKKEKEKSTKLVGQVNFYEQEIQDFQLKLTEQSKKANEKILKFHSATKVLMVKNDNQNKEFKLIKDTLDLTKIELEKKLQENLKQAKIISDLRDVISHREQQLGV